MSAHVLICVHSFHGAENDSVSGFDNKGTYNKLPTINIVVELVGTDDP